MAIDLKLIDKLLADYKKPEDIIGENSLIILCQIPDEHFGVKPFQPTSLRVSELSRSSPRWKWFVVPAS